MLTYGSLLAAASCHVNIIFYVLWCGKGLEDQAEIILNKTRYWTPTSNNTTFKCIEVSHDDKFSSVAQLCATLCDPMDCSTPGFPVHHHLLELTQTQVHYVGDAIQPSHPLSSPSLSTFNLSQHQGLFKYISSSHQVANVLEFQLQHQSLQWIFRTDFL